MAEPHAPAPIVFDPFPAPALPALFGAAIGPVGAKRYLPLFTKFETLGRGRPGWNWVACLCTFNWMIFRRLWLPAVLYAAALLVLPLLLVGAGRLLLQWSTAVEVGVLLACAALACGLPALLGDLLLYRHCRSSITRALERAPTLEVACSMLTQSAPSRVWLQRQLAVNGLMVVLMVVLGYLAWPTTPVADVTEAPPTPIQPTTRPIADAAPASASAPILRAAATPSSAPISVPISARSSAPSSAPASAPAPAPLAVPGSEDAPEPASKPAPLPASAQVVTTPARASAPSAVGYHVNVGLFADPDNARRAYVKLVQAGLPAQREVLTFNGQKLTRVRVGPFASRAMATAAVAPIKKLQLDAVLDNRK
ncbi:MAG: SPOR domain-containing protein [Rhodoferax sp.]|nr:SPOR domain-containing protein [Rhodoferax sp.]